ncbi:hypothetical protein AURDEDRAFT_121751 [Auricularia subglabra TFB-10046 SS5]|nr:hypothetical protein AURDEDRAFT_121751 [Auricularia subglabra TFB-10046 SS5]
MSSTFKLSTFTGEKLKGPENFLDWHAELELWLMSNDLLWLYVEGPCEWAPTALKAAHIKEQADLEAASKAAGTAFSKETYRAAPGVPATDLEWSVRRMICYAGILLTIAPDCRKAIKATSKNDPAQAMRDLRARYGTDSAATRVLLFRELLTARKPGDKDWSVFHDEVLAKTKRAYGDSEQLPINEFITMVLVIAAPSEWQDSIRTLQHKYAFDQHEALVQDLTSEENIRKSRATEHAQLQALIASAKPVAAPAKKGRNGSGCTNAFCIAAGVADWHDLPHCFKEGGGMANNRPAWFRSRAGRVKAQVATAPATTTPTAPTATPTPSSVPASTPRALSAFIEDASDSGGDESDTSYESGAGSYRPLLVRPGCWCF